MTGYYVLAIPRGRRARFTISEMSDGAVATAGAKVGADPAVAGSGDVTTNAATASDVGATAGGSSDSPGSPGGSDLWNRVRSWVTAERAWLIVVVAVVAVLGLVAFLRFWTPSQLWLDEALTVDISRLPISQIPHALRLDGAPPLFYFLLHFWMLPFGTSNLAVRSLSGVIGLVNLPLAFLAGEKIGARSWRSSVEVTEDDRARGRVAGWTVMLLLATSPFTVYYDTESRMYALVILLVTTGLLSFLSLLARPRLLAAAGVAASAALLLYTQYWALYLLAVVGAGLVVSAIWGPVGYRRACRYAIGALVVGGLCFVPWLPTFWFQLHHTGTPWATPADWTALVFTFTQFAGGNSTPGRALGIVLFFLVMLALFGAPVVGGRGSRVELDLRTRRGVRLLMAIVVATLVLAVALGKLTGSAFADRYTAVVVLPALLVVAYGVTTIGSRTARVVVTGLAVGLGLFAAVPNAYISRTQAGQVATYILQRARPGDVVAYCPDQLGPSVSRVIGGRGGLAQVTYPRETGPAFVDWVDYAKVNGAGHPARFARFVSDLAGPHHTVWYVSAPGYLTFGPDCGYIGADLAALGRPAKIVVAQSAPDTPFEIFEGESLVRFGPG
jgi:hypothetical protein